MLPVVRYACRPIAKNAVTAVMHSNTFFELVLAWKVFTIKKLSKTKNIKIYFNCSAVFFQKETCIFFFYTKAN